jgi:hypothetical protein
VNKSNVLRTPRSLFGFFQSAIFLSRRIFSLRVAAHSELHDCEAGDHLEVANIGCRDAIAEFQRRYTDQQISQWQPHSPGPDSRRRVLRREPQASQ